jgi:AmiR/NasT family two-component response regulator
MDTVLVVQTSDAVDAWPTLTGSADFQLVGRSDCAGMVRKVSDLEPSHVLILDAPLPPLLSAMANWKGMPPAAVCLVGVPPGTPCIEQLVAAGLHAWNPREGFDAKVLLALLAQAAALRRREEALRLALTGALAHLDERKWIDRAKGLLMSAREIGEDEAFGLLRNASMHANLRLVEVSRSVIDAARWAEAINRSGQLRMLSQRLVRLAVQRLAKVGTRRSRELHSQSVAWVEGNLEKLHGLSLDAAAAQARLRADAAWAALKLALDSPVSAATLPLVDSCAEELLAAADALTLALEIAGARRALRIVNICGAQRMRAHRLAKDALLIALLGAGPWSIRLAPTIDEFEAALLDLERAPLSTPDTRAALLIARDEWLRLIRGTRSASAAEGRAILVRSSEALAEIFDTLTAAYEHSLQVIMS